jgi:hypothetical protein
VNLFYDYFVTPRVAFLPREVVEQWCAEGGARIIFYDQNRGANVHSFCLVKESQRHAVRGSDAPEGQITESGGAA